MYSQSQRGVVLIVALVLLLVVTLLGVVAMQGARFQMKMTNNAQERQQAFNSAEATLAAAERVISTGGYPLHSFEASCGAGANCFNANCNNGLCFAGAFNQSSPTAQQDCTLGAAPAAEVWRDPAIWSNNNRHASVNLPAAVQGQTVVGMYIIEFRCFIDGQTGNVVDNAGDIFYRITALGTSFAGNAQVMVQSTYRSSVP